jgi:hypothetical protein
MQRIVVVGPHWSGSFFYIVDLFWVVWMPQFVKGCSLEHVIVVNGIRKVTPSILLLIKNKSVRA